MLIMVVWVNARVLAPKLAVMICVDVCDSAANKKRKNQATDDDADEGSSDASE